MYLCVTCLCFLAEEGCLDPVEIQQIDILPKGSVLALTVVG